MTATGSLRKENGDASAGMPVRPPGGRTTTQRFGRPSFGNDGESSVGR